MEKYEVYWRKFCLGILTVEGEHYTYEVFGLTSEIAQTVMLNSAVLTSYDGGPVDFFKAHIDAISRSDKSEHDYYDDQYLLKAI